MLLANLLVVRTRRIEKNSLEKGSPERKNNDKGNSRLLLLSEEENSRFLSHTNKIEQSGRKSKLSLQKGLTNVIETRD